MPPYANATQTAHGRAWRHREQTRVSRVAVHRDAADHQPHPDRLDHRRQLPEHDHPDDRRGRRQERDEQRVRRAREPAIASWSQTYGMTEEAMPTPTPAAIATGSSSAGIASQPANGVTTTSAAIIDAASPSSPVPCATRWLSTM